MLQAYVAVQLQWPLKETIFSSYQKLLARCICLEMVFYSIHQYYRKMLQVLESKECLELPQLEPKSISTLQSHQRWVDTHLENVFTVTIGTGNILSTRPW